MTTADLTPPPPSATRRLAGWLHRRPHVRLVALLAAPISWLVIAYLGALVLMLLNAFWSRDAFTGQIVREITFDNFAELSKAPYPEITLRTLRMAAAVTVACAIIAFPIAFFMARMVRPRWRGLLVVAVVMPLWASYLVKAYAWRLILAEDGVLNWMLGPLGLKGPGYGEIAVWIVMTYLWLPYMIIPIYAGLERIPNSLLEASADLGGRSWMTFRRVILPLAFPAIVAGSIFTFSLTLGDYIAVQLVSTTIFIGNAIYTNVGAAGDLPLAAALSLIPLAIILVYLFVARKLGAFEAI